MKGLKRKPKVMLAVFVIFMVLFTGISGFIGLQVFSASTQLVTNHETTGVSDDFLENHSMNYESFCNSYKVDRKSVV